MLPWYPFRLPVCRFGWLSSQRGPVLRSYTNANPLGLTHPTSTCTRGKQHTAWPAYAVAEKLRVQQCRCGRAQLMGADSGTLPPLPAQASEQCITLRHGADRGRRRAVARRRCWARRPPSHGASWAAATPAAAAAVWPCRPAGPGGVRAAARPGARSRAAAPGAPAHARRTAPAAARLLRRGRVSRLDCNTAREQTGHLSAHAVAGPGEPRAKRKMPGTHLPKKLR